MSDQPKPTPTPTPTMTPKPADQPGAQTADDVMAIRRAAGSIAEVIEPVQRTRQERTDR